jgi:cellulose synthase/poly-beta-1,6-N-acetylglucosamine synthase-like glycosyltransferase
MLADAVRVTLIAFNVAASVYFFILNSLYLLFTIVSFFELRRHRRRWTARDLDVVMRSPATPAISLIVPAYNEEATIRESLRALLLLNYPEYEVVVINDGSKDGTVAAAAEAFEMVRTVVSHQQPIATQEVRAVYRSLADRNLVLIDKVNGGKADAMNAGINAARHPLVCVIDADSLLEEHALTRAVLPFLEDPRTIAAGGIIRVVNGCRVEDGRVTDVRLPTNLLAAFQVAEYLRAFLAGRVAQSAANGLLLISGAFGLFRRDAILRVGGFRTDTVGEDMEIIVRMHRHYCDSGDPYRIVFRPDPVCWTEVPESMKVLGGQRNRWQRGTLQVLRWHRDMMFKRRYGVAGVLALPYFFIFEALGPFVEVAGYMATIAAVSLGLLDWRFAQLLFLLAICYGALISLAAVLLEELSFRRYPRLSDLLRLAMLGIIENFGYRQLSTWWRLRGTIDFFRGQSGWGVMTRQGFQRSGTAPGIAPGTTPGTAPGTAPESTSGTSGTS